jgi:hypothetical protein
MHQFSDDTQYRIDFQLSPDAVQQREALSSLADCATVTEDWFTQNRVKTNMDKSIFMYVSSTRSSSQLESLSLQVGDNVLAPSLVARNLGVSIDSTLYDPASERCVSKGDLPAATDWQDQEIPH